MERNRTMSLGSDVLPGLSKLMEEMGEVQQVCGKLVQVGGSREYWGGVDLYERLQEELADLLCAVTFVIEHNGFDKDAIVDRVERKLELYEEWHKEQE